MTRFTTTRLSARKLPLILAVFGVSLAVWPAAAGADTGELDAGSTNLDVASEEREEDSAFLESWSDVSYQPDSCATGLPCGVCQKCVAGTCVDLPAGCTADSECGVAKYCALQPDAPCKSACKLKPGACVKNSDCGKICVACQSNTCVDLNKGDCGPTQPCPDGWYCDWDQVACTRTCKAKDRADAANSDSDSDTAQAQDTAQPEDTGSAKDADAGTDGTSVADGGDAGATYPDAGVGETADASAIETKPDSGATVPPTATSPAPDPGCSTGRQGAIPGWMGLMALVVGWVAGRRHPQRTGDGAQEQ